ncbi:MAG: IS21-like element helper ATPase IstB [Fibrobacterota bacterium]
MKKSSESVQIRELLKELHLPAMRENFELKAAEALQEQSGYLTYLRELLELECTQRREKSVQRRLHESNLPLEKSFDTFEIDRFPQKIKHQIKVLREGSFLDRCENVLAFGCPGTGKSHLLAALGQELIRASRRVYFASTSLMVQELLRAKSELRLDKYLKRLSCFDAIILDDIGYVQQDRQEMEVLFTLLAARYERGSVMITSNLQFSKWESIFKDPMTTAAAIDRLVHHSVILELDVPSYRMEQAQLKKRKTRKGDSENENVNQ